MKIARMVKPLILLTVTIIIDLLVIDVERYLYPGAFNPLPKHIISRVKPEQSLLTSDGVELALNLVTNSEFEKTKKIAAIFHGDTGDLESVKPLQDWLLLRGLSSVTFDYRGFGESSGFPSESGIYNDSDAIGDWLIGNLSVDPRNIMIIGVSFGAAPAARCAARINSSSLVLLGGYKDFPTVDKKLYWFPPLVSFIWPKFSTINFVSTLFDTSLYLFHGEDDREVEISNAQALKEAYKGSGTVELYSYPNVGHRDIFEASKPDLRKIVNKLLDNR